MALSRVTPVFALTGILLGLLGANLAGQQVEPVVRTNLVVFEPVSELTKDPDAQVSLRGARLANPEDWPASFYSIHSGGSCTSTLVGPRALLTAAHCVPNKGTAVIRLKGKVYNGVCTQTHQYSPSQPSAGWAMCLLETKFPSNRTKL